jgi:hypothetical protein
MSRRDTILVAILINAGLLLILFITAMTSDHQQTERNGNTRTIPPPKLLPQL